MKQSLASKTFTADQQPDRQQQAGDVSLSCEARLAALRALMPYEAPQVVSLPLGGTRRIFPVYMGNM